MPGDILLFRLFSAALLISFGTVAMRASCSTGDEAGLETLLFLVELNPRNVSARWLQQAWRTVAAVSTSSAPTVVVRCCERHHATVAT